MQDILLDERLETIASLVGEAASAADIGADHGRLACALLERSPDLMMTVSDVSAPSLEKARRLLRERGLLPRVRLCVADGLAGLEAPVEAIIIAGMGSKTIRGILESGREKIGAARLILQPNLDADQLRMWLCRDGFRIVTERVARASGRFYPIICARQGESEPLSPQEAFLGPRLLRERPLHYEAYLRWLRDVRLREREHVAHGSTPHALLRRERLDEQLTWIEEALSCRQG